MDTGKRQFILAMTVVIMFSLIIGFVIVYGAITGTKLWAEFQPFSTGMFGTFGAILGYYFRDISTSVKNYMQK